MTAPVKLRHGRVPLGIAEVTLTPGSYLRDLQDLNATATLPHAIGKLDESGIPEWATSPQVDGAPAAVEHGWLSLDTAAPSTITLDVSPTAMVADARVDAVRGAVAIQAGPTVLCAEAHDNPEVDALAIDPNRPLTGDPTGATGSGAVLPTSNALYRRYGGPTGGVEATPVTLIPYREWGRRGRVSMRVWLPTVDL